MNVCVISTLFAAFFIHSESWSPSINQMKQRKFHRSHCSDIKSVGRYISEEQSLINVLKPLIPTTTPPKTVREKIRSTTFPPNADMPADISVKAIKRHFTNKSDQNKIGLALLLLVEAHVSPAEQLSARAMSVMIAEASSGVEATLAAILFQAVLDEKLELSRVEELFGEEVSELTENCAQMIELQANARALLWSDPSTIKLSNDQAENSRNMLIAMAHDWRVVAVVLVQQVRSLTKMMDDWSAERSSRRSRETYIAAREALEVYGPLAHQLGMHQLKNEIENLGFQILYPHQYLLVTEALSNRLDQQMLLLNENMKILKRVLAEDVDLMGNLGSLVVDGRKKSPYSTWRKIMKKRRKTRMGIRQLAEADQVLDALALRVVFKVKRDTADTEDVEKERAQALCYHILGLIHNTWSHMEFRVKDYVSSPKANGYQALHTTALVRHHGRNFPFEVQVRTDEMHRKAEWGLAAHFLYTKATWDWILESPEVDQKQGMSGSEGQKLADPLSVYTKEIPPTTEELKCGSAREYAGWLHDVLQERRVYVLDATKGVIVGVRRGATLKESYDIPRTYLNNWGHFRINGHFVPSYYELRNGDVIELNRSWKALGGQRRQSRALSVEHRLGEMMHPSGV